MKILIINDYAKPLSGAETFIYTLKRNLEERGHTVKILGSKGKEDFVSFFSRWYSVKWYNKTLEEIKKFKPDIVHVNNCPRKVSPSVINASLKLKIPTLLTFHDFHYVCPRQGGVYKKRRDKKRNSLHKCFLDDCFGYDEKMGDVPRNVLRLLKIRLHRKIIKNKKLVLVAPSKYFAKKIGESIGRNVLVINNGINIPKQKTNYKKNILFVGALNEEKGFAAVAPVLNKIKKYKTFVLGDGPIKKSLELKYKNIEFLGYKNPIKSYENSSIAIIPSHWKENFSYSVLEAMSYGLCIIASDAGGIPEQIKDKETGLISPLQGNFKEIFEKKLNYLIKNPKEIKRLGNNARIFAKKNFDWKIIIKEYEELYEKLIKNGK